MASRYEVPRSNPQRQLLNLEFSKEYGRIQPGGIAPVLINKLPSCWTEATFGLMPHSAGPRDFEHAYHAHAESADKLEPFHQAWKNRQLCVIPMQAFFVPSYTSGSHVLNRFENIEGDWFGVAGLWEVRSGRAGDMYSFTVLTTNVSDHVFMRDFYKDGEEKRIPAVLPSEKYQEFLGATSDEDVRRHLFSFRPERWQVTELQPSWRKQDQ